jgi:hypothetical protein
MGVHATLVRRQACRLSHRGQICWPHPSSGAYDFSPLIRRKMSGYPQYIDRMREKSAAGASDNSSSGNSCSETTDAGRLVCGGATFVINRVSQS